MTLSMAKEKSISDGVFELFIHIMALKSELTHSLPKERLRKMRSLRNEHCILFCVDRTRNCTVSDIEKALAVNRSATSIAVSKLDDDGLVEKKQPQKGDDGRKVYLKITKKGKELLDELNSVFMRDINGFYESLSDEKKQCFVNGIVNLNKVFN